MLYNLKFVQLSNTKKELVSEKFDNSISKGGQRQSINVSKENLEFIIFLTFKKDLSVSFIKVGLIYVGGYRDLGNILKYFVIRTTC